MSQFSHIVTYQPGLGISLHGLKRDSHSEELLKINERKFVAAESEILKLFKHCRESGCNSPCEIVKTNVVGCTLELWWSCSSGHKGKWRSSEKYAGMYANNLQFSAAVLLSGNNYGKIETMSRFLGLADLSRHPFCVHKSFTASLL